MTKNVTTEIAVRGVTGIIRKHYFEHHAYPSFEEIQKQLQEQKQLNVPKETIEHIVRAVQLVESGLRAGNMREVYQATAGFSVMASNLIDALGNTILKRRQPTPTQPKITVTSEDARKRTIERLTAIRENARDTGKKYPMGYRDAVARALKAHSDKEIRQLAREILSAMKKRENRATEQYRTGERRRPPQRRPPRSH